MFQPFLRFYDDGGKYDVKSYVIKLVSTLLEILPLMLGGFLGF